MLNENGLTFKDFEKKTFEMICKLGQEYTRDFLERYDTYLMKTRDKEAYRNKGKKKTTVKTVYGEVEYERRIYRVTREDGLTEFVFLLDEQRSKRMMDSMQGHLQPSVLNECIARI